MGQSSAVIATLLRPASHSWQMPLSLTNTGTMRSSLLPILSIAFRLLSFTTKHHLNSCSNKLQTILYFALLGAPVGHIFAHTTPTKWITAQPFVFFLATAPFIEDINVCNNQLAESLSLNMSSSMNPTSHSSKSILLLLLLQILPQHYPHHSASHSQILWPLPSPFHQPNSPLTCQTVKTTHQKTPHQPLILSNQTLIP